MWANVEKQRVINGKRKAVEKTALNNKKNPLIHILIKVIPTASKEKILYG